ncbi:MAG TPA: ABC transporter substrate-binding protein [Gemmatimonadaceae bacterium]|nr:ABC transporter substrate-binding protein [Gemmatimonadaceae bacterium]
MKSRYLLAICAILPALACRGGEPFPDRHALIDSRDTYDPRSLDPALSTDVPTGRAVSYVFDGLTRFTPDARVEPGLADRWDVAADGLTYSFHLHPGVRFHDGSPLLARHVKASFERVLNPATRGGRGETLFPIVGARAIAEGTATELTGVTVVDDSTLIIRLVEPLAFFPKLLAMPATSVVPDSIPADFGEHPVGSGPWKLVEWRHDDYLKFARNDDYFAGAPLMDTLIARIIPEPSTAVAEFESGRVDLLLIPQGETRNWQQTDEKKAVLQSAPALALYYVAINVTRGPLADVRVRQAINHAIDVPTILAQLFGGRGQLANGVIPPSLDGADTTRARYAYDTTAARRLLREAGHPDGIDIELWHSQDAMIARLSQAVQAYLNAVGIRTTLVQRDASSAREASRNGETDLILKTWYADYPDADSFLYPLLHSGSAGPGGNVSFYANAQFDRLATAARRELDDSARAGLARQADSLAYADAPMVPMFFYDELYGVQPWVRGFRVPSIFNGQRFLSVTLGAPVAPGTPEQ